ncbi:MAG: hypothetical protein LRZ85_00315, partial [Alphaproteobacteria bacterium]|nr:hypothetical protein [Alphaproteobacteria bacterium]
IVISREQPPPGDRPRPAAPTPGAQAPPAAPASSEGQSRMMMVVFVLAWAEHAMRCDPSWVKDPLIIPFTD